MKQLKPFTGKWRIVEMEAWDQDYVDMEVPGFIRIGSDGTGQFQFGLVSGDIDGRIELSTWTPIVRSSRSIGITGHVASEQAVTMRRNTHPAY